MRRVFISRRTLFFVAAVLLLGSGTLSMLSTPSPVQAQDVIVFPGSTTSNPSVNASNTGTTHTAAPTAPVQVAMPTPPPMRFVSGLEEPLVATSDTNQSDEGALSAALTAFIKSAVPGTDFADRAKPLEDFVAKNPSSPWRMSVLTNLGLGYYHAGYFSSAFANWEQAWNTGRNATSPQAKALTDRAVGELARMHARVGHAAELEKLFADIGNRPISGPATEFITGAREGLAKFHSNPGIAYLCGPQALKNLLINQKATRDQINIADNALSGPHGFSLDQLAALSTKAGLDAQLIYRAPGQPVPMPAVVNWNVHHYAAIVEQKNGRYHVQDPTFGSGELYISPQAIDKESSGYFLVPSAQVKANAAGDKNNMWRVIAANSDEAKAVYGMGYIQDVALGGVKSYDPKINPNNSNCGMCGVNAHAISVSVNLSDTPVGYVPQKGPSVKVTLTYNQREAGQPANFSFSNVSQKWSHNWMAWIEDDPNNPYVVPVTHLGGGGEVVYYSPYGYDRANILDPELQTGAVLERLPSNTVATSYVRTFPDGSTETYGLSDGSTNFPRRFFLTQVADPQGNAVTLNYDGSLRLTSLTDATGRNTTFTYGLAGYPLLVTQITDPFGRSTTLNYDTSERLSSITDTLGITSSFGYDASSLINTMTTPYGTSNFAYGLNAIGPGDNTQRYVELTDPLGLTERVEFDGTITSLPASDANTPSANYLQIVNGPLNIVNSAYWDKHVYPITHTDYTKAVISNWLVINGGAAPVANTILKPLESRLWFNYQGEYWTGSKFVGETTSKPGIIARLLDDGSTQVSYANYNIASDGIYPPLNIGNGDLINATDAVGRTSVFNYDTATGYDLQTVQQQTSSSGYTTTGTYSNYTRHLPGTYTDAAGQVWNIAYNAAGQPIYATDPLNETTFWEYDSYGRLTRITIPDNIAFTSVVYGTTNTSVPTKWAMTYDGYDRVQTKTDSEGYVLTYAYDNLDRVITITYPDSSSDHYDYTFQSGPLLGTQSLNLRKYTDRLGRVTTYTYDADQRLVSVTEPLTSTTTRTTSYNYYENGTLEDIIDANGNDTHWAIDIESRPISKTYAYGTSNAKTETYTYENSTSRLKSITDALGQVKTFTYNHDNTIAAIVSLLKPPLTLLASCNAPLVPTGV